ncbi:replication-relaxation family protein [Arthrobacter sp. fls2-241-R2A-200]|uniref:replication-relaxation family protein n=1 Tax=Arthrobacter sp. fls2-241-R2A-200 TaxID=3040281 RepID=UPI00254F9B86|nr:replication-relaxation family protein [Arthrobacter sp. fls2-241-R2A-200]
MTSQDALPVGYPFASKPEVASPQVDGETMRIVAPNTGASASTGAHTGPRVSRRRLHDIEAQLSDRDRAVLSSVERFRFLTAEHIEALHFADHASAETGARTCRRVLVRLRRERVLGVLNRRVGGVRAGSEGLVYFMDTTGERIQRGGESSRRRRRFPEPSARFLDHTLAIADVAIGLIATANASGAEVANVAPEKEARRYYTDRLGGAQVLRPDLYVELAARPGDQDVQAFFVEVDLGHESLPTVLGKCQQYEAYYQAGIEQRDFGGFPSVVWAMGAYRPELAERRRQALQGALRRGTKVTPELYRIYALDEAAAQLVQEVWHG